ncbi:hypothetical protein NXY55_20555 [Aeromonas veronii]|nr:hypothetical protein [Aeromonas veronii]
MAQGKGAGYPLLPRFDLFRPLLSWPSTTHFIAVKINNPAALMDFGLLRYSAAPFIKPAGERPAGQVDS